MHLHRFLLLGLVTFAVACSRDTPPVPPAPTVAPPAQPSTAPRVPAPQATPAAEPAAPSPAKPEDPNAVRAFDESSVLTVAVQDFVVAKGRMPRDPNKLVTATIIAKVPAPPKGYRYVIDPATRSVKAVKQ